MNDAIHNMLKKYNCRTAQDYTNALKEIIQEVALVGLWRSKFFDEAAFYGGTALRILYNLDRFSEDLDFSLLNPNSQYDLTPHLKAIQKELLGFGFHVDVNTKAKSKDSAVQSAFLKGNTLEHLIEIGVSDKILHTQHRDSALKIKLEVDTDPPAHFTTTTQYLLQPIPFFVRTFSEPDLFAGKIHAILCRSWKNRVKGRDWYDLVWYIAQGIPLHIQHLEMRLRQSGHYTGKASLTKNDVIALLEKKIGTVDFRDAKADVTPFVKDPASLDLWSREFFNTLTRKLKFTGNVV